MKDILNYSELQEGGKYYFVWKERVMEGTVKIIDRRENQKQVFVEGRMYYRKTGIVKPETWWVLWSSLLWCYEKSPHELYNFIAPCRKLPVKKDLLAKLFK